MKDDNGENHYYTAYVHGKKCRIYLSSMYENFCEKGFLQFSIDTHDKIG